ncbi:MAG: hypothetical protein WAM60_23035 [Candidatus Promineifilaceae bacterium]
MNRKLLPLIIGMLLIVGVTAVLADGNPNLANNHSFEGQYSPYIPPNGHPDCPAGICNTAQMAPGWTPWWRSHNPADPDYIIRMPEYAPANPVFTDPSRVRTGDAAQKYFTFFSTHEGGFYQQVSVVPGVAYKFQIWGHAWSAQDDNDAYSGPQDGSLYQKVGIDPTGGDDWQSSNIIWSAERLQYDTYGLFEVSATAQSSTMTVYVYSRPNYAVKHNDVYWDDAQLLSLDTPPVIPLAITLLTNADAPQIEDYTVYINWLGDPGTEWHAALDPAGTVTPILSSDSGMDGDPLIVTLDTDGFSTGTYATTLTVTADPAVPNSPVSIPVTLIVAEEISTNYMPMVLNN